MLASARFEVPDTVTGLIGVTLIGLALWSSVRANAREERDGVAPTGEHLS